MNTSRCTCSYRKRRRSEPAPGPARRSHLPGSMVCSANRAGTIADSCTDEMTTRCFTGALPKQYRVNLRMGLSDCLLLFLHHRPSRGFHSSACIDCLFLLNPGKHDASTFFRISLPAQATLLVKNLVSDPARAFASTGRKKYYQESSLSTIPDTSFTCQVINLMRNVFHEIDT